MRSMASLKHHIATPAGPVEVTVLPSAAAELQREWDENHPRKRADKPITAEQKLARLGLTKEDLRALLKD